MPRGSIDLNADMGESFGSWSMGQDDALLDIVSSASIACGFHAGDPRVMWKTVHRAAELGVTIGAHVAYNDLVGFGRRRVAASPHEVRTDVLYQVGALVAMARSAGTTVPYVKPHGALYDAVNTDASTAAAVVGALADYDKSLLLLTMAEGAGMAAAAEAGIVAVAEAFPDRAYDDNGKLVSRSVAGSVLQDPDVVAKRAVEMAVQGVVTSIHGCKIKLSALASICVHGDTAGAARIALAVRTALERSGVVIKSFV